MKTASALLVAATLMVTQPQRLLGEPHLAFPVPEITTKMPPPKYPWPWPSFSMPAPTGSKERPLSFVESLGALTDKSGRPETLRPAGRSKLLGLYFTSWKCGPCRKFSPILLQATRSGAPVEIVVVSRDYTPEDFSDLAKLSSTTWPMVPYESEARKALFERYEVRGVPALLIFSADGELLERQGRALVTEKGSQGLRKLAMDVRRSTAKNIPKTTTF